MFRRIFSRILSTCLYLCLLLANPVLLAQTNGPGLGNLSYNSGELFNPVSIINSPGGHGNVAMVNGYLMVIYSSDGGGNANNGGIQFWDVSDPRSPTLAVQHDNSNTHGLREPHGFGFSNSYPGDYMVAQGIDGIQFWDVSDPFNIALLDYMNLPGISQGDYSGDWWVFWQAPYVYVAGQGSGLYVVDASDPANPVLARQMTTSELGGLNPAVAYAIGNLLIIANSQAGNYATLDISDPVNPVLIQNFNGKNGYSHLFAAGMILTSGGNGDPARMYIHNVSHAGVISAGGEVGSGLGNGGYGSYQDGFFHSGFSSKYAKFNISGLTQVGTASSGLSSRDEDFGQVLANIAFVGDDHAVGSALVVHQTAPDTSGPDVHWVHPAAGASGQAVTSRVGLSMSDNIDIESVDNSTFIVRELGGVALSGKYSVQMGLVNFSPDLPLAANTTYEVIVDGVTDLVGNSGAVFSSTFSTGSGGPPPPPPGDDLISNVDFDGSAAGNTGQFSGGELMYSDRSYTYANPYPVTFEGEEYILTRNDDKNGTGSGFVSFDLSEDATVYVLFDNRATSLPAWLNDSSWSVTGDVIGTTDNGTTRVVYEKDYTAGAVALGGNADAPMSGASSMYSVVAIPLPGNPPPNSPPECVISSVGPAEVGASVVFDIDSDNGTIIDTYSWDFGDGSSSDDLLDAFTTHAYSAPGRYAVVLTVTNSVASSTCSLVQIIHHPLTTAPARNSAPILYAGGFVYNVNPDNNTVTAIDDLTLSKAWEVAVGNKPQTLTEVANGDIWVVNQDDATISVLNPVNGNLITTHTLPYASRPYGMVFNDSDNMVYISLQGVAELAKVNSSGTVVGTLTLAVGSQPRGIAISADGSRVLLSQFVSSGQIGRIREVSAANFTVTRTFNLGFDPGPDTEASGRGVPNYISSVVISPDGRSALVPSKKDNLARGLFRDGQMLNFESMVRTIVSRLDLLSNSEDLAARIDLNDRNMAQAIAFSPFADIYFVATQGNNKVEFFDATDGSLLGALNTGLAPQGLVLNDDASRLFVHNYMSRSVSVFDVRDIIDAVNNAGSLLAEISAVSNESLSTQVLQGKQIFYNAADPRMSQDAYVSCASCHLDGGSDGQVWDFTQAGEGLRNTISLRGRTGLGHGLLHWTANFDEVQDFEHDIRHFAGGSGFMSEADFNATSDPLGNPKTGLSAELDALAAYVSSLSEIPDSPYRNADGTLTSTGEAGKLLFTAKGCDSCHAGNSFRDGQRHDVGTIQASSGQGIGQPLSGLGFDTPTLLGLWNTEPYLHNGQAATLYDVLADSSHVGSLSASEKDQLVDYMLQIDQNEVSQPPPSLQISNMVVSTGKTYELDQLASGIEVFIDRNYTWTSVPALYQGETFIRTANDDKSNTSASFLSFDINIAVTVYVLFDDRVTTLPGWLDNGSWSSNSDIVDNTDKPRRVYYQSFAAGTVVLGGNNRSPASFSGGRSNYNVVVIAD